MSKKKILVVNGPSYASALKGLGDIVITPGDFLQNPEDYKLVMFTGGSDVDPAVYGDTSPQRMCNFSKTRDDEEIILFNFAKKHKIAMVGICRGAQLLNVLCGGRLMHHINGHNSGHLFKASRGDDPFIVTSSHHQMIIPGEGGHIIGTSTVRLSDRYYGRDDKAEDWTELETEAIMYPEFSVFGTQYHPEWMPEDSEGWLWYNEAVKNLLTMPIEKFTAMYVGGQKQKQAGA